MMVSSSEKFGGQLVRVVQMHNGSAVRKLNPALAQGHH
jgi:hypothetical protein